MCGFRHLRLQRAAGEAGAGARPGNEDRQSHATGEGQGHSLGPAAPFWTATVRFVLCAHMGHKPIETEQATVHVSRRVTKQTPRPRPPQTPRFWPAPALCGGCFPALDRPPVSTFLNRSVCRWSVSHLPVNGITERAFSRDLSLATLFLRLACVMCPSPSCRDLS